MQYIEGNTFPVRDQLRKLGCRWDAEGKRWYTHSHEIALAADEIVRSGGLHSAAAAKATGTPTRQDHETARSSRPMIGTGGRRDTCWRCGFRAAMFDSYGRPVCSRHMGED